MKPEHKRNDKIVIHCTGCGKNFYVDTPQTCGGIINGKPMCRTDDIKQRLVNLKAGQAKNALKLARAAIEADWRARGEPVACRECGGNGAGGDHEDDCKYLEVPSKCSERPDPVLYAKIQTLRKYQAWRTGEDERTMDEAGIVPAEITSALDAVIKAAENYLKMETK